MSLSRESYLFTSESVSEGHPDKICDQVSDAILDLFLSHDPHARVAAETMASTNCLVIAGETRGPDSITHDMIEQTARDVVKRIGYEQDGFHWRDMIVDIKLHSQSVDIAQGVDEADAKDEGAGDQGIMFGYACQESEGMLPAPLFYSHRLLRKLAEDRHAGILDMLGPDSKSQFTLLYENGKPVRATSVVLSTQHQDGLSQDDIRDIVTPYIERILPEGWMPAAEELYINPTGRFVIGGPDGDAGLTGRKIIVDTYGGAAPHGGGAFSGKDPTKVDRSAAYAARYLAKNIVAAGLSNECTIQLAYAIGVSKPLSIYVDLHNGGQVDPAAIEKIIPDMIDLSPRGIRQHLNLNRPIYSPTAAYGHFGRKPTDNGGFSWEKTDLAESFKNAFA